MARTMIGLFSDREAARQALTLLLDAGFAPTQLGLVAPHTPQERDLAPAPLASEAAAGGGVLGATAGALLAASGALVIPGVGPILAAGILASLIGGAAGWLAGALVALGVSPDEAEASQAGVRKGGILLVVKPHGRDADAQEILTRMGAETVRVFGHDDPATPSAAADDVRTGPPTAPH